MAHGWRNSRESVRQLFLPYRTGLRMGGFNGHPPLLWPRMTYIMKNARALGNARRRAIEARGETMPSPLAARSHPPPPPPERGMVEQTSGGQQQREHI